MITPICRRAAVATLALCCLVTAQEPTKTAKRKQVVKHATLDAKTRAPTKQEATKLGLKFEVRVLGQLVTDVMKNGAAAKSGLKPGDVLVSLGGVDLFSQDDIADVLRVHAPGQKIKTSVLRANTLKHEVLRVTLGSKEVNAPKARELAWDYASLVNLPAALAKAKAGKLVVLVGLSGAET